MSAPASGSCLYLLSSALTTAKFSACSCAACSSSVSCLVLVPAVLEHCEVLPEEGSVPNTSEKSWSSITIVWSPSPGVDEL
ncbi:hypothetical protein C8Q74DRAFT_1286550 [Fomes fomentarius]|nr:hypothetical protein C8Q74DRAFT_1286550 [Fomes fomentarius]